MLHITFRTNLYQKNSYKTDLRYITTQINFASKTNSTFAQKFHVQKPISQQFTQNSFLQNRTFYTFAKQLILQKYNEYKFASKPIMPNCNRYQFA